MRVRVKVLLLLCALLTLAFTANGETTPVKIQYLAHASTPSEIQLYRDLGQSFRDSHPEIDVEVLPPKGAWLENLIVLIAGGLSPDAIFCPNWWIPELVEKGLLADITAFAAGDRGWDDSAFFPVTIAQTFYKGKRYAVPRHFSPMLVFYNRDAFQDSGLPDPHADWTWDGLRETAARLTRHADSGTERWGLNSLRGQDVRNNAYLLPIVRSFGGDLFSEDGKKLELVSPTSVAAVQWVMDLALKDRLAPPAPMAFQSGAVAMNLDIYAGIMHTRNAKVAFDWDLAQVPTGPAGRVNRAAGGVHGVVGVSKHPQQAWEWIKFLASREAQQAFASSGLVMGARRDSAIVKTLMRDDVPPKNLRLFMDASLDAQPYPMTPNYNAAVEALSPAMDAAWTGSKPFSVAVSEVKEKVEAILQQ